MRWVFYLLLALNAGYFFWWMLLSDYFQVPESARREPVVVVPSVLLASEVPRSVRNAESSDAPLK